MPAKLNSPRRPWEPPRSEGKQTGRLVETDFYNSMAWRKLRDWYKKGHPLCEQCEKKGIIRQMKIVDHIKAIRQDGEPLDPNNLQSLCEPCHNSKSGRERHGKS
jgi:5-methylcytosine-specific restriction enzyme A